MGGGALDCPRGSVRDSLRGGHGNAWDGMTRRRTGWLAAAVACGHGTAGPWTTSAGQHDRRSYGEIGRKEQIQKDKIMHEDFCKCVPVWHHVADHVGVES